MALTAAEIRGSRTAAVRSWPSTVSRVDSVLVPISSGSSRASRATAGWSAGSTPWASTHQVSARYMAPVSR